MGKRFVLTFFGVLAIAVPLYAQTSGHTFGTGSSASGGTPSSPGGAAGSTTGGNTGGASGMPDRTPTPGSMSGGLMQGSGVNTNSGTGSNATGTTGATGMGRTGTDNPPAGGTGR